jgi:hypothetical protein
LNKSIFNSAHSLLALFADPSYTVSLLNQPFKYTVKNVSS